MTRSKQLWSGDITLGSDSAPLQDISLTASSNFKPGNKALIPQNAELSFLSFVVPSRIPLYLVVGRGLDVWTDNEATESWFRNVFLSSPGQYAHGGGSTAWWNTHRFQSDTGVLLHVGGHSNRADLNLEATIGPKITEVLLYGAISENSKAGQLPTPLSIPSPTLPAAVSGSVATATVAKQLRVHALLLSSEKVYSEAQAVTAGVDTEDLITLKAAFRESGAVDAQFLPSLSQGRRHKTRPLLKRRRGETLFEDTTEKFRKARRSDGKNISQDIVNSGPPPLLTPQSVMSKADTLNAGPEFLVDTGENPANFGRSSREGSIGTKPQSFDNQHHRLSRSGSPHLPDIAISKEGKPADQTQSTHKRNTLNDAKQSLLPTFTNTAKGDGGHQVSQTGILKPLNLPETQKITEIRNKEMLSRIVMAGMRIYGLQQQKKPNKLRGISDGPVTADSQASLEIDEYKLVYHQTFKGACFAFRRHIATTPLKQGYMRDVVDKLLAVFCNDPLVVSKSEGDGVTTFGQDGVEESPFGPDSGQRQPKMTAVGNRGVSTPRVRRRLANRAAGEPPPRPAMDIGSESPLARRNASATSSIEMITLPRTQENPFVPSAANLQ
ncbi:MAG: hypothetical protein M1840_008733 [Geoglossum simile]|nr:MAG: hypothetical protein M1840_008733 [Geoglossum simile]